ncbi:MAG TPA: hypothetical protein DCP92_00575 [Nitrospiraceae bacterium]|jgi:hypothetical protein|nr:hypothetical protein [Nitrospiraceae bacterium]
MAKKVAVLVRERQSEALRMAVGLTLLDDIIDVYLLDSKVAETEENALNLETIHDLDMKIFTNYKGNENMEYLSTEEIARKLVDYDHILPY